MFLVIYYTLITACNNKFYNLKNFLLLSQKPFCNYCFPLHNK